MQLKKNLKGTALQPSSTPRTKMKHDGVESEAMSSYVTISPEIPNTNTNEWLQILVQVPETGRPVSPRFPPNTYAGDRNKKKNNVNVNKLRVCPWNISGYNSILSLNREQAQAIADVGIICLVETWKIEEDTTPPGFLKDFKLFAMPATRDKSRGRGSEG